MLGFRVGHGAGCEPLAVPGAARAIDRGLGVTIIWLPPAYKETTVSLTSTTASTTCTTWADSTRE